MSKNINIIPLSISAETEDDLTRKCLLNNQVNDMMFEYNIVWDGQKWVAWFMVDRTKLKRRVR